jgi:hypothetical protein
LKAHPVHQFDADVRSSNRAKDFLKELGKRVEEDSASRDGWMAKCDHYRRRRYAMEFRNPTFPWPGSSAIVPPLIDKKIDELKPQYLNLVTAVKPPVTALAITPDSQAKTANVELWYEWLIKFGSPRFVEEIILCIDDLLEIGRGVLKSVWHYETHPANETILPQNLPERLRKIIVTARNEKEADQMYAMSGRTAAVITRGEFDERRDLIQKVVESEWDLDHEEPKDRKALEQIMGWLRAGAKGPLKIEKRDTTVNVPGIVAVSPKDLIVPEWTTDVEQAEHLTHVMWFNEFQLRAMGRDAGWDEEVVRRLMEKRKFSRRQGSTAARQDNERQDEALREGLSFTGDNQFEVLETCTWFSPGEGQPDQKVVILYPAESPETPFKFYAYQRPSMKWPFHTASFELNKRRWYSPRGVPEKLDDLEYEIIQQHRAKLNRMTIANAPTFTYEIGSGITPSNYRWIPGQFYPVKRQGAVQPMVIPNIDISFEREEQILRTWAEEYLGGTDFGLANPLSSMSEARTATEINAIQGRARQSLSLRGTLFQRMMGEVYREMLDLWLTWGDPKVWVQVTGGEPIKLSREDLQGQFELQPTGTIGEQDPQMEAQKSLARVQVLMQAKMNNIAGDEYEIDLGKALLDWMEKDDVRTARNLIRKRSPEEVQQIQQQRQAMLQEQQQREAAIAVSTGKPPKPQASNGQQRTPAGMGNLPVGAGGR